MDIKGQKTFLSTLNTEVNLLAFMMFIYTGSIVITDGQTAVFIKRSGISLKRDRQEGRGIPSVKLGRQTGSDPSRYLVTDVARYIVDRKSKVAK